MFKETDPKLNLPKMEEEILKFWDENKIFEKSLEIRKDSPQYSFYDGPPFATGTPHYGHIVASTIKDIIPRYQTMRGNFVERVWGWDCHGLPIENIAEKELGITAKKQIEEIGVDKFEEACRLKVTSFVKEWEAVIHRLGRWADMKNAYKTMDLSYMESVWWTFRELWNKELIYEGYRSMYICPRCETTLSQSEVAEGYKDIKDLSVTVEFNLLDEKNTSILAWTTTPWTLIGNVALAVGADITYVEIEKKDEGAGGLVKFILAKDQLERIFGGNDYKIVSEFKGSELVGKEYRPLFDYYQNKGLQNEENGWKIYPADFVTTAEGTGIVHIAPAFGEDDLQLGQKYKLPFIQHVGMDGIIKPEAIDFAGMHVKPKDDVQKTDIAIIKYLAGKNLLFAKEKFEHSYPHCWRCDTPLINFATSSWFVAVTKIKEEALKLSKEISWSPKYIKEGRFGNWLEGARDWSISRQRYWASVMPIWKCGCGEIQVFGSIKELEEASGQKINDLHKYAMDKIEVPCKCGKRAKRIPDVLDTWFDSGSMPYAQLHYPFENEEKFDQIFPADFIAEGIDQTRCWFYYLHIIATAIKNNVAYKNVIVSGTVLAEDGKKMSKKLQNYPDPAKIFDKYGADVLRLHLLTSSVMSAENLNFKESELSELQRGIFRMLWNSYYFFILYANIDHWSIKNRKQKTENRKNILDRWILSELHKLILKANEGMENYDLARTTRLFQPFLDNLSNWYIRRSRKRFWKSENDLDKENAYHTLYEVLVTLSKLMAPFTPFITDEIYKNLTQEESVHLAFYPISDSALINKDLNQQMETARKIVETGLSLRSKAKIKVRQPLSILEYVGDKLDSELKDIVAEEVNVKSVKNVSNLTCEVKSDDNKASIDTIITKELKLEGLARDLIRNIQSLRKEADFNIDDRITISYKTDSNILKSVMTTLGDLIAKETLAKNINTAKTKTERNEEYNIEGDAIWIGISRVSKN